MTDGRTPGIAESGGPTSRAVARPVGLITNDPAATAIAARLAATGTRVLHLMLPPLSKMTSGPNLEAAATVADIAIECQIIALAIDDMSAVRHVLLGDSDRTGLMHDMAAGSVLIDFGMHPAKDSQSILGMTGLRGVGVVDAAILGGNDALQRGTASVLAGGFPDAVDTAMPFLGELGVVERTGPLGSAQTAAALMGYVEEAHLTARADAVSVGAALGLKSQALSRLFSEAPEPENVLRLKARAEFARSLMGGKERTGNVISFRRLTPREAT